MTRNQTNSRSTASTLRPRPRYPLHRAIGPILNDVGFIMHRSRTFVRETQGAFQHVILDASGVAGRASTSIHVATRPIGFPAVDSYVLGVRHGPWNLATPDAIDASIAAISIKMSTEILPWLAVHAEVGEMLRALQRNPRMIADEPIEFSIAACQAALGDIKGGVSTLKAMLVNCSITYWGAPASPACLLLQALERGEHSALLAQWADENRAKFGLVVDVQRSDRSSTR